MDGCVSEVDLLLGVNGSTAGNLFCPDCAGGDSTLATPVDLDVYRSEYGFAPGDTVGFSLLAMID